VFVTFFLFNFTFSRRPQDFFVRSKKFTGEHPPDFNQKNAGERPLAGSEIIEIIAQKINNLGILLL